MSKKVVFKEYNQEQQMLLPPSYDELIPLNHPVRIVNKIVDSIDLSALKSQYKGGGTSSYHPKMLLKVLIYAYLRNIYSSRKIEQALYENIHFMWLSSGAKPDHNTINNFRGKRLKNELKKIFHQVVYLLSEEGVLSLKELFVDGTKIEANANRYTFVWGKSITTRREKMKEQLKELWEYVEIVYKEEQKIPNTPDFQEISSEKIEKTIKQINDALEGKDIDKKVKQKLNYVKKNFPKNIKKYEEQEKILKGRNSYSKTDTDATFMRMKEDHMQNGQLKPAYNLQISTNNQFITNYGLAQTTADTTTLKSFINDYIDNYKEIPESVTADAGYGSEENYVHLEKKGIEAFVKYNYFNKEQKNTRKPKDIFLANNLDYNKEEDCYYCPIGKKMKHLDTIERITKNGFKQKIERYQAENCKGCLLKFLCHKSKYNRIIEKNYNLIRLKEKAKDLLLTEEGIKKRSQRCWDVEPVFGDIKHNMNFKRFSLRGLDKANTEIGLIAMAHNINKFSKILI